jgi:UDP-glucose 4-epimerase
LEPKRDFNFVSDTVSAFLRVASLAERSPGAVFNAGSGRMVAISEIVEEIRRVTGCDKPVIHEEQRKRPADSEVMTLMANAERLEKQAGWHPTVSLEDGLTRTIDWWCKRPGRMRPDASYMV